MKKAAIQSPMETPEYVVQHARWQESRGRNPSMPFRSVRNPREALKFAIQCIPVGEMSLSETEIMATLEVSRQVGNIDTAYEELETNQDIRMFIDGSEEPDFELRLTALEGGIVKAKGIPTPAGQPNCKLFEATVNNTTDSVVEQGSGVFGIIFPDQVICLVDSAPDSGQTAARLAAAAIMNS